MERLPVMECIMTPSNGEHLKERKIKERGTPGEKHIPTKQKRRSTGQGAKSPLPISGLKKMGPGWRLRPRAFAPQASVMASSVRDAVGHEYTCFMRWGEDARLHGRFHRISW